MLAQMFGLLQRPFERLGQRKWQHAYALLYELARFAGAGLAADTALGGFAIMDFAGLFGKTSAHVGGVGHEVAADLHPAFGHVGILRAGHGEGFVAFIRPFRPFRPL